MNAHTRYSLLYLCNSTFTSKYFHSFIIQLQYPKLKTHRTKEILILICQKGSRKFERISSHKLISDGVWGPHFSKTCATEQRFTRTRSFHGGECNPCVNVSISNARRDRVFSLFQAEIVSLVVFSVTLTTSCDLFEQFSFQNTCVNCVMNVFVELSISHLWHFLCLLHLSALEMKCFVGR